MGINDAGSVICGLWRIFDVIRKKKCLICISIITLIGPWIVLALFTVIHVLVGNKICKSPAELIQFVNPCSTHL